MKTVVLYNIISFIIIVALIFVLRIVSKSNLRQNQQLVIKVIAAREMGLEKDKGFVASLSREHLLLANARSKELGYPGGFTKGMKFRGNQYTGRIRVE